ncbi:sugar phosphate isomerase [Planctomycetia bacterium]|nr:sugar phosphate isomerase [Planctomycetia bacterium]
MSLSSLPLSYCTNVHPGLTVAQVERGLTEFTVPAGQRFGSPLAAGLWLAQPVIRELLSQPDGSKQFAARVAELGLCTYTLNAFPFGDFHSERVKENVYLPDWTQPSRLEYSWDCARVLAELIRATLSAEPDGSLSTVPLGFKALATAADFEAKCICNLIELARRLARLESETGQTIRLAIEPEPCCVLETTAETIAFFRRLRGRAADEHALEVVERHLGVCYDICHQSVEFEDVAESIASLAREGIRINKVHITCALQITNPGTNPDAREALAHFVEPRYLHQTLARSPSGEVRRVLDLTTELARTPPAEFATADNWRIHFHVPVDAERIGPLETTRADLKKALVAVKQLTYAPHLEVETYTWNVLPGGDKPDLITGLARELSATRDLLAGR